MAAYFVQLLVKLLQLLSDLTGDFALAIVLFVLLSKVVLFPLTILVQKNSIRMIRVLPELNEVKAKYFYDPESLMKEQGKINKREGYSPLLSAIPMILQLVILLGMIAAIRNCVEADRIPMITLGLDLRIVPAKLKGIYILSPVIAAATSYFYNDVQNRYQVLQAQQSKWNQYSMLILSVLLSLYLGWFVSLAVALYWSVNNVVSGLQTHLVNRLIDPNVVDKEALQKSIVRLEEVKREKKAKQLTPEQKKLQKEDYKRFFSVANKHLVFYSEAGGYYKYYRGVLRYLLEHSKLTIHYVTSDPADPIRELAKTEPRLRVYFVGEIKLIELMMRMDADVVVMTTPDLDNLHIKKSYLRKDITYIYYPHSMDSINMTLRRGAVEHFDVVFCTGKHDVDEIRKQEEVYHTPAKRLLECGYPLMDELIQKVASEQKEETGGRKQVLLAPSWQEDNILDSCLNEILESFEKNGGFDVTVRPHPHYIKHNPARVAEIDAMCARMEHVVFQKDFSSDRSVYEADLVITDWSSISYEYAFSTKKPVIFINTPMKVVNPDYRAVDVEPINIRLRKEIGAELEPGEVGKIAETAERLTADRERYRQIISDVLEQTIYNVGSSAEVAGEFIMQEVREFIAKKKAEEK